MEQFMLVDPRTGDQVEVTAHPPFRDAYPENEYREVGLRFADGRLYAATFWRPSAVGRYEVVEPGMVLVHNLTSDPIRAAVEDFLRRGAVEEGFDEPSA